VRPEPLSEAAARRHELTRAKAIQALRELDRVGAPVTFAGVASAAGVSRSWLYTQPDISGQIRRLRKSTAGAGSAASSPAHSATSDPHGPDQVTIQAAETAGISPRASRQRHCPRRDAAGHSPG
jgi:hypothetical protein